MAFEPEVKDFNDQDKSGAMEVTAVMQQLEELDHAAQRSVAVEVESALESGLGDEGGLVDEVGRARILDLCTQVHQSCKRLDNVAKQKKITWIRFDSQNRIRR